MTEQKPPNHTPLKTDAELAATKSAITQMVVAAAFRMIHAAGGIITVREDEIPANISFDMAASRDDDGVTRYHIKAGPWSNITLPGQSANDAVKRRLRKAGIVVD